MPKIVLAIILGMPNNEHISSELSKGKKMGRQTLATINRNKEIAELCKSGLTLEEVGKTYGITRERVRQIVAKLGIPSESRGKAIQSFLSTMDKVNKAKAKEDCSESICQRRWGMSIEQYKAHVAEFGNTADKKSPMRAYATQRKNAHSRGIEWKFTFVQWWAMWQESGKWNLRGRGTGYVMARHGDSGHYGVDNVYICTAGQNSSDSYITSPASVRFASFVNRAGKGKGYCYQPKSSKHKPYAVQFRGKYIGAFATPDQASNAYLAAYEEYMASKYQSSVKQTQQQQGEEK